MANRSTCGLCAIVANGCSGSSPAISDYRPNGYSRRLPAYPKATLPLLSESVADASAINAGLPPESCHNREVIRTSFVPELRLFEFFSSPLTLDRPDSIADANLTLGEDPAVEAASVNEGLEQSLDAEKVLQIPAGGVQPHALEQHVADQEPPADQMIERHPPGDHVAPRFTRLERDTVVSAQRLKCLLLEQGHLSALLRL